MGSLLSPFKLLAHSQSSASLPSPLMASSLLRSSTNPFLKFNPPIFPRHTGNFPARTSRRSVPVRCGRRDGRGPLVKGRTLSIEAIQAVQTLKRAHRSNAADLTFIDKTLSRLIKSDLVATLRELLRQDECALALPVLAVIRSEYSGGADYLSLYADVARALARSGDADAIDELVAELERDGGAAVDCCDRKGLGGLLQAVIGADRRESTVRIYRMMRRNGWGSTCTVDDHIVKVLIRGLRRFGEEELADEVQREFGGVIVGKIDKMGAHT